MDFRPVSRNRILQSNRIQIELHTVRFATIVRFGNCKSCWSLDLCTEINKAEHTRVNTTQESNGDVRIGRGSVRAAREWEGGIGQERGRAACRVESEYTTT